MAAAAIAGSIKYQHDIGREQDQMHEPVQDIGALALEIHHRHQQCDEQHKTIVEPNRR